MARYVSGRLRDQIRPISPSGASMVPRAHPCATFWVIRVRQTRSANDRSPAATDALARWDGGEQSSSWWTQTGRLLSFLQQLLRT